MVPLHSTSVESMNCLLVMKIKWSLDINTGAVERSEAARARSLAGATVGGAKYPSIFGVGVPNTLGYLEWGCKISGGAKYPVTPGLNILLLEYRYQ